jgi:transposase
MSYSLDLRERVLSYLSGGGKKSEASKIFGVSRDSIYRWEQLKKIKGRPIDDPPKRSFKKLDPEILKAYVKAHPDEMLKTYAQHFNVDPMAIFKAFKRLKITRKKRLYSTKKEKKQSGAYFWKISKD